MDKDLELVAQCIAASFYQQQALEQSSGPTVTVPNGSTTWPMFHYAVTKLLASCPGKLYRENV